MKKINRILCLLLVLLLLAGCGAQKQDEKTESPAPTAEESTVALPNPVKSASAEEIEQRFGIEMKAPEGAEEISRAIIEGDMPLAQLGYSLDGIAYTYRAAKAEAYTDISGMYYEWQEISAAESGGGSIRLIAGGPGVADGFDAGSGIIRSVSVDRDASSELLKAAARQLWGAAPGASADGLAEELCGQFDRLRSVYFPGTAGSSLSSAACAAEMADFFFVSGVNPDTVDRIVQDYRASLPEEDARLFEAQLDGVVGAFSALTGEGGRGLLDDCGYESSCFPWDAGNVRGCFVALLGTD